MNSYDAIIGSMTDAVLPCPLHEDWRDSLIDAIDCARKLKADNESMNRQLGNASVLLNDLNYTFCEKCEDWCCNPSCKCQTANKETQP